MCYYNDRKRKEIKKMSLYRENLLDRMIQIYGFESPIVLDFCEFCEDENFTDHVLEMVVESHELYPVREDD
jgi:hypothetical protein